MTISTDCPVCGLKLDVPQTSDAFGNPIWDAAQVIAAHVAEAHPAPEAPVV